MTCFRMSHTVLTPPEHVIRRKRVSRFSFIACHKPAQLFATRRSVWVSSLGWHLQCSATLKGVSVKNVRKFKVWEDSNSLGLRFAHSSIPPPQMSCLEAVWAWEMENASSACLLYPCFGCWDPLFGKMWLVCSFILSHQQYRRKAQVTSLKRGQKECETLRGVLWNADFWTQRGHCTPELTTAMVTCVRTAQSQAKPW